jgi:hypothetical protein
MPPSFKVEPFACRTFAAPVNPFTELKMGIAGEVDKNGRNPCQRKMPDPYCTLTAFAS